METSLYIQRKLSIKSGHVRHVTDGDTDDGRMHNVWH